MDGGHREAGRADDPHAGRDLGRVDVFRQGDVQGVRDREVVALRPSVGEERADLSPMNRHRSEPLEGLVHERFGCDPTDECSPQGTRYLDEVVLRSPLFRVGRNLVLDAQTHGGVEQQLDTCRSVEDEGRHSDSFRASSTNSAPDIGSSFGSPRRKVFSQSSMKIS